jgi:hypothetical protein
VTGQVANGTIASPIAGVDALFGTIDWAGEVG